MNDYNVVDLKGRREFRARAERQLQTDLLRILAPALREMRQVGGTAKSIASILRVVAEEVDPR